MVELNTFQDAEYSQLEEREWLPHPSGKKLCDTYRLDMGKQYKQLLMHSPMGIRIDFNMTLSSLELWLSPQAGKDNDYWIRNFSNRDDHTKIFDRILFAGLDPGDYIDTEYDPFHSVVNYKHQKVHILSMCSEPAVAVWFDKEDVIDIKSDKQDTPLRRDEKMFAMSHPDRGLNLEFTAAAGNGSGTFWKQPAIDRGRSTYTRITLEAGQKIVFGGELKGEDILSRTASIADTATEDLISKNETEIEKDSGFGLVTFRDKSLWQKQFDLNRRVLLSGEDKSGVIHAAFRDVYYLIWHGDAAITAITNCRAGNSQYLERFADFGLSNPTETETPVPGTFMGQLVNGKIAKQELNCLAYEVLAAFTHWTQTGSDRFLKDPYMQNMLDCVDYNERHGWDTQQGAFEDYYVGEDPFFKSHDFGFDAAVGRPMNTRMPSRSGVPIVKTYPFGYNALMYNIYLMLAAMNEDIRDTYLAKAEQLEAFLNDCTKNGMHSGFCVLDDGSTVQSNTTPRRPPLMHFLPDYRIDTGILTEDRRSNMDNLADGMEEFAHRVVWNLIARDPARFGSEDIERFFEIFLPQCQRSGEFLQMPGTVPENINCPDGDYHDNRPQFFSTGPLQELFVNRGLFRLPYGLALRGNPYLESIKKYSYLGHLLDITFEGEGDIESITINGSPLEGTHQIPVSEITGDTKIKVIMGKAPETPRLVSSTLRLEKADKSCFEFTAFGRNVVTLDKKPDSFTLEDESGNTVMYETYNDNDLFWIEFKGTGYFKLMFED